MKSPFSPADGFPGVVSLKLPLFHSRLDKDFRHRHFYAASNNSGGSESGKNMYKPAKFAMNWKPTLRIFIFLLKFSYALKFRNFKIYNSEFVSQKSAKSVLLFVPHFF